MAKRERTPKRPQAEHKPKSRSSPHDKRKRLDTPNPQRKKTVKAKVPKTPNLKKFRTLSKDAISLSLFGRWFCR